MIYRLSGDRNPLHSDPWFARELAGFPKPILHGLCTYGVAGRALVGELGGGDATKVTAIASRFTSPVFPGETLTTSIWRTERGARCSAPRRRAPTDRTRGWCSRTASSNTPTEQPPVVQDVHHEAGRRLPGHTRWRRRCGSRCPVGSDAGRELELCIVLPPDRSGVARLSVGDFDELLGEQARNGSKRRRCPTISSRTAM